MPAAWTTCTARVRMPQCRVQHADAVRLIAAPALASHTPQTWADLGSGDGVFTRALASQLTPGSTVHAMDRDAAVMKALPSDVHGVAIRSWTGDVTVQPYPFGLVDGLLLANVLHYVRDQSTFLRGCRAALSPHGRLLVVEYDTDRANPWVPYPVTRRALTDLCIDAGFAHVAALGRRPSIYQRAPLYSVWVETD